MAKRPESKHPKDVGEDKRPAGSPTNVPGENNGRVDAPVEHPRRLRPGRDPYKNRILTPDRTNGGYDTKD
jgi:hypothetical protein